MEADASQMRDPRAVLKDIKELIARDTPIQRDPEALLAEIDGFLADFGVAESTFGMKAAKDSRLVERVRTAGVTLRTVKRIRSYMAAERAKAGQCLSI
jgi:hypothetical protein